MAQTTSPWRTGPDAPRIRVLLVDDHVLFRRGILSLLQSQPDIQVVGEAGDGAEALTMARQLAPDVILMDIRMPVCDGIEATRLIKSEMPSVRVLALTVSDDDADLFQVIKNGAQGYLLKDLAPEDLFKAIRGALRGEAAISPTMAAKILAEFSRQAPGYGEDSGASRLTQREREVLQLVAQGASNKSISQQLRISESTARNHMHNILEKLHLQNRVQAAMYAKSHGLGLAPARAGEEAS